MPNIKLEGKEVILYVSDSEPASATDESNYTRAGLVADLTPVELENEEIEAVDRDDGAHDAPVYGTQSSSWSCTANSLKEDDTGTVGIDAGHKLVRDAALNQDPVYFLMKPSTTDLEMVHGRSLLTNYSEQADTGSVKTWEVQATNVGKPTFDTVT
jgi:hypothetical protein